MSVADRPRLFVALAAAASAAPLERKLLVCRRHGEGRELLRALVAAGHWWVGFEVTTLWQLAQTVAGPKLAEAGLALIDEFDQAALLDEAIERVLGSGEGGRLAELAEGSGLRQAVAAAVQALRMAGIDAAMLGRTRLRDEAKRTQLARLLTRYEQLLQRQRVTDAAGTFRSAVASLRVGDATPPPGHIFLLPGLSRRGLSGELVAALVERGARVLPEEAVHGLGRPVAWLAAGPPESEEVGSARLAWLHAVAEAPAKARPGEAVTLFAATSVMAELREVLRRVLAGGHGWDQVEIVATDALGYGVALDDLARRLGIPVTYAGGLPVSRTRPGRAVVKYLEWLETDFPADVLRGMLERGDLEVPGSDVEATRLAGELRRLRIGRGRERYQAALERAQRVLERPAAAEDERTPQELAEDRARRGAALAALGTLVRTLLAATPAVPGRLERDSARVAPAALATGLLALLRFVPRRNEVEHTAHGRLGERLERIARTATRPVLLPAAVALLRAKLDARVPAPDAAGGAPWSAAGGHLHFSDVEHGGYTQRPATFVVGLDAVRFPGSGLQDALLLDDDRRRLTPDQPVPALPTAADRVEEKRYALAALLARLRGSVTLSYSTWDAVEGRAVAPAAELLQAYRLRTATPAADYDALHAALAPLASAVPRGEGRIDASDVWLGALADDGTLRYGIPVVRAAYPQLDAGLGAAEQLRAGALTPWHGAIAPRPHLDPRQNPALLLSASQLETLGTCPHRYLLRYVLRVRPPEDPELSPEQWLNALERGALLHRVYERALTTARGRQVPVADPAFEKLVVALLDDEIAAARAEVPPPGEAIFALEAAALRGDALAFVAMVREDGERWLLPLERRFGGRDGTPPLEVPLPGGAIRLWGAIDRIDRLADGRLAVIDYKTGNSFRFRGRGGAYDGGRRLQHVLYAAAVQALEGQEVARAEYQFPTVRAENHRARYEARDLAAGLPVVDRLLSLVSRGVFHHTVDRDDCRFCDYQAVCRVRLDERGDVTSPRAEWAREARVPELDIMRGLRR